MLRQIYLYKLFVKYYIKSCLMIVYGPDTTKYGLKLYWLYDVTII